MVAGLAGLVAGAMSMAAGEYLPFSASGRALLFQLLSRLYECTSVVITTNLSFSEWATVFGAATMTSALPTTITSLKPEMTACVSRQAQPHQPEKKKETNPLLTST
jgi:hypothetical protein